METSEMSEVDGTIIAQGFNELFSRETLDRALHLTKVGASLSPWLIDVLEQIVSFGALPENWDSYGADAPRPDLLWGARTLICSLARGGFDTRPYVYPTRSGGVQFEWEQGSRYLEIEVVGEFAATYHYSDSAARTMTSGEVFQQEPLDDLLQLIQRVEAAH
jgi:hypothetical protein